MNILVYIGEQDGMPAVVCGHHVTGLVADVAQHGAKRIIVIDHPAFAEPLYAPRVDMLAQLCARYSYDLLLFSTTVLTCEIAAGLAARLEAGVIWGMVDIEIRDHRLVGKRLAQNDTILAEVEWTTQARIGLFRPCAFQPCVVENDDFSVEAIEPDLQLGNRYPQLVERISVTNPEGPSLREAEIVVSGGRGIETRKNLDLIKELAAALGGVPGVSLPLVEMGWAPRSMQVGQTGTVVKPRLYVACGISGQIQHRIGMEQSGTIVAINKDPDAPIMNFCDLAVVAEIQSVVPRLIDLLRRRQIEIGS
ncbi:MAG: electron transfer flavoprotein subunit alpha/FixB family protein [Proteobacteria bacterium]|nr:electron transfer flavoprotein subunit alpha/FixB family protein [Pseudomonadota bacterium]